MDKGRGSRLWKGRNQVKTPKVWLVVDPVKAQILWVARTKRGAEAIARQVEGLVSIELDQDWWNRITTEFARVGVRKIGDTV